MIFCSRFTRSNQIKCPKCMTPLSDYKNFKEHFEAKHPKDPLPTEESLPKA